MSLLYYSANKSFTIVPIDEEGRKQSFAFGTPACEIALSIIKAGINVDNKLRFFTQWGKKVQLGNYSIESTPTNSFNVLELKTDKLFSTYPSFYMEIINAIYKNDPDICSTIISNMLDDKINQSKIAEILPTVTFINNSRRNDCIVKGKYGIWSIDKDTLSCSLNGKRICIVCNGFYKKSPFSEKEQLLISKLITFINDELFYKRDTVIKNQVDHILRG